MKNKLSVVLATRNEAANIERCLKSVKKIADEIIIVDEYSEDNTRDIAKKLGATVHLEPHHDIFHITKQKALDLAKGEWILQLDADETVTPALGEEILKVVQGKHKGVSDSKKKNLFKRHQELIEKRDGKIGTDKKEVTGYFIPRRNMFLGKPLIHAGVYPDGVIRLVKNGYARFPQKSVHEQIKLDGKVSWLENDLLHYDSPTLRKYFVRMNRYTDLKAAEFEKENLGKNALNFILYTFWHPAVTFCKLFFRHLGFLDGVRGFLWSFFSALHFPIEYWKYFTKAK